MWDLLHPLDLQATPNIAAGIGNIYKNELLFYFRCDPTEPVGGLGPDALRAFYEKAAADRLQACPSSVVDD